MPKGELRLNDAGPYRGALETGRPAAAPVRTVERDDHDAVRRRARRLALVLMAASSLLMIALFAVLWLLVRRMA